MTFHGRLELLRKRAQAIEDYLQESIARKLQLGTGTNVLQGWLNTDLAPSSPNVLFLDSTQPFPFNDGEFRYVFSEHHIEHLTYDKGLFMLRECYRVLQPGGKIRIATPNLETLLDLYTSEPNDSQKRYIRFVTDMFLPEVHSYHAAFVINNAFRNWGHEFIYDHATLRESMQEAGFAQVCSPAYGESEDIHLRGIEGHGDFIGDEGISRFETMVLEGRRPS